MATMELDMIADMEVEKVADMEVDKVADMAKAVWCEVYPTCVSSKLC